MGAFSFVLISLKIPTTTTHELTYWERARDNLAHLYPKCKPSPSMSMSFDCHYRRQSDCRTQALTFLEGNNR